jgi:hypothetical protein
MKWLENYALLAPFIGLALGFALFLKVEARRY